MEECVDILKVVIEFEKIDECVLNGDSNDFFFLGFIYFGEIQISVVNILIGNEMIVIVVGFNSINLIFNVFINVQIVQIGLVVGIIVSVNNNFLIIAIVFLIIIDNMIGKNVMCLERYVLILEVFRDGEFSCDSIVFILIDLFDKYFIIFQ